MDSIIGSNRCKLLPGGASSTGRYRGAARKGRPLPVGRTPTSRPQPRRARAPLAIVFALILAAAGITTAGAGGEQEAAMPAPAGSVALLPDESPPPGAARQFSTDFSRHTVPYAQILSGGPPKDGIPAVDAPQYLSVAQADGWLEPREPVAVIEAGGLVRAYPIQVLTWHEIVNDRLGDLPVTVTFCPLCNTAIAFDRRFDGRVLDFGTTGRLYYSNLIMYDRQTETWWQQATGEAIAGVYAGSRLRFVPLAMISWEDFKAAFPDGDVVSSRTGHSRRYGVNPYQGYDRPGNVPFLYRGPVTPSALPQMARVLTIELDGEAVAYPYDLLQERGVVNDRVGGMPVAVLWSAGAASALDHPVIASGRDVGAAVPFSREVGGRVLEFERRGGRIVDTATGSVWNHLGRATAGELAGAQLTPVVGVNHFWFSWAAFRPETRVFDG